MGNRLLLLEVRPWKTFASTRGLETVTRRGPVFENFGKIRSRIIRALVFWS